MCVRLLLASFLLAAGRQPVYENGSPIAVVPETERELPLGHGQPRWRSCCGLIPGISAFRQRVSFESGKAAATITSRGDDSNAVHKTVATKSFLILSMSMLRAAFCAICIPALRGPSLIDTVGMLRHRWLRGCALKPQTAMPAQIIVAGCPFDAGSGSPRAIVVTKKTVKWIL